MILSRAQLIAAWVAGFKPQAGDYQNHFDSFWHKGDTLPGAGGAASARVTLSATGITADVEYNGESAPTLTGSAAAGYTLTIPSGTSWRVFDIEAVDGGAATNTNLFSITVVNQNTGSPTDRAIAQIKDLGTDEILDFPQQQRGIIRTETVTPGTVVNEFTSIGALTGFAILFTR